MIVNPRRVARKRAYLLCPPEHFAVQYAINPWMDTGMPVDVELALKQWTGLREALARLGHTVHTLEPRPDLPDMVYAANSALTVDGVAYGARFRYPQRVPEAAAYRAWYEAAGWRYVVPAETNEGEGDFAYLPAAYGGPGRGAKAGGGGIVLAGYGFRTEAAAHAEAQEALGRPVISLRLVDPRFYHLDTALAVLDDATIAYFPEAFSGPSRRVLRQLFPDAVIADAADAEAFGLNAISDGRHVVLNAEASGMASKLAAAGYVPVPVELGELKKGGGSAKCCVAELRAAEPLG
jgi:N-dimethylarginine dimethylaminohydrolase